MLVDLYGPLVPVSSLTMDDQFLDPASPGNLFQLAVNGAPQCITISVTENRILGYCFNNGALYAWLPSQMVQKVKFKAVPVSP